MLVDNLRELLIAARSEAGKRRARVVTTHQDPDIVYIFLLMPKKDVETYDEYRLYRSAMLHAYCKCAKLKFPDGERFIGLALDHPIRDYRGGSEDLIVYICKELTQEARQEAERFRREFDILPDSLPLREAHQDEYPTENHRISSSQIINGNRRKDKNIKRKAKISKASRRANRRK